jgi:molybdopterin converting factor small subunit
MILISSKGGLMVNNKKGDSNMATLEERKQELLNQQKQMEANFHQITGAIALVEQMIKDEEEPVKDVKDEKKK